jgi:putative aldouronate transport system substrate-binding protein
MKKNMLKRSLALAMSSAMVMGALAGCSDASTQQEQTDGTQQSGTTDDKKTDTSSSSGGGDTASVEGAGIDSWQPFADNVKLQIPVYDRGGEVDVTNNYWTQWVQTNFGDKYNITVEFVAIPRGDVLNAYANLANAQDLPTILMEYDFPKQAQWADDGYLQELDLEKLKTVAPNYYAMMEEQGNLDYTDLNDTTYFALAERPYSQNTYNYVTFYRQDWLDQLGLEYPTTWEDTLKVYAAIKEAGLAEYPAGGTKISGAGVDQNYGYRSNPQDEYEWATTGDYAIPALSTEAQKNLLKRRNELYNLGYFNPDFTQREAADGEADFIAGNAFTYSAYIAPSISVLDSFYETNPDAHLSIAVCPGLIEDTGSDGISTTNAYRPNNNFGMMIGFSALASDDEITAAMMYMEWMLVGEVDGTSALFTMQYGIEGETFEYDENGYPVITNNTEGEYAMANNNKDYWCVAVESKTLGTIEDDIKLNMPVNYPDSDEWYQQILDNYKGMESMVDSGVIQPDCNFAVTLTSVTDNQEALLGLYEEFASKLTVASEDEFDTLYEQFKQEYLDAGYQAIIDERGQAYNDGMTSKMK